MPCFKLPLLRPTVRRASNLHVQTYDLAHELIAGVVESCDTATLKQVRYTCKLLDGYAKPALFKTAYTTIDSSIPDSRAWQPSLQDTESRQLVQHLVIEVCDWACDFQRAPDELDTSCEYEPPTLRDMTNWHAHILPVGMRRREFGVHDFKTTMATYVRAWCHARRGLGNLTEPSCFNLEKIIERFPSLSIVTVEKR